MVVTPAAVYFLQVIIAPEAGNLAGTWTAKGGHQTGTSSFWKERPVRQERTPTVAQPEPADTGIGISSRLLLPWHTSIVAQK